MVLDEGPVETCAVCESPQAATHHFGARSCKACAAFFRRTVSMRMKYRCVAEGKRDENKCRIHHLLRMICRACRYEKCIGAGMKTKFVQRRRDGNPKMTQCKNGSVSSWVHEKDTTVVSSLRGCSDVDEMYNEESCENNCGHRVAGITCEMESKSLPYGHFQEQPEFISNRGIYQPAVTSDRRELAYPGNDFRLTVPFRQSAFSAFILERAIEAEKNLNDSRRIVYGTSGATKVFTSNSELPFTIEDLRPMNFVDFNGPTRIDLMMLLQYVRSLPFFLSLPSDDKKKIFQNLMAIDPMITAAYLSMTLGRENHWMVHSTGRYICMNPQPPSGNTPEDAAFLEQLNPEERRKYQLYMPMKLAQYTELCLPFAQVNPSFVEYASLKVIALLLRVRGRVSPPARAVIEEALQQSMHALYDHCVEKMGQLEGALRFGNITLQLSPLFVVSKLIEGYVKIDFFNLNKMDPVMRQMLSHS